MFYFGVMLFEVQACIFRNPFRSLLLPPIFKGGGAGGGGGGGGAGTLPI